MQLPLRFCWQESTIYFSILIDISCHLDDNSSNNCNHALKEEIMEQNNKQGNDQYNAQNKRYVRIKLPLKSLALFIFIMSFAIEKIYSCAYHVDDDPISASASPVVPTSSPFIDADTCALVTYDMIQTGSYAESYVLLDTVIGNIKDNKLIKSVSFDAYYKTKNGYFKDEDILIDYSEQPEFKKMCDLKNGITIRSCLYIETDNSFGEDFFSFKVLKAKKKDIHNLKIINKDSTNTDHDN